MYSEKLQEFIEAHRPAKVVWDEATIRDLAAKVGLEVRPAGHYDDISSWLHEGEGLVLIKWGQPTGRKLRKRVERAWFLREVVGLEDKWVESDQPEREHAFVQISFPLTIKWEEKVEGNVVTYRPDCRFGGSSSGKVAWPMEDLMAAGGLLSVSVELPEPTITLPAPEWLSARASYSDPWEVPGWDTLVCFASETPAIVAPFITELAKLADLVIVRRDDLYEAFRQIRGMRSDFPLEVWERLNEALGG